MPEAEISLPPETHSVSVARSFALRRLQDWDADPLEWPAAHVVSELVTNAVLHARSAVTVSLRYRPAARVLLVEVHDESPQRPVVRHYPAESTTGRGLALVEELARGWGVRADAPGKTVWCELSGDDDGRATDGRREERAIDLTRARPPRGQTEGRAAGTARTILVSAA